MPVVHLAAHGRSLNVHFPAFPALPTLVASKRRPGLAGILDRLDWLDPPGPHGSARDVTDLPAALRRFLTHPRPPVLLAAVASVAAARLARGRWTRGDATLAAGALAAQPFVEWAIHREILHARPGSRFGDLCWRSAGYGHAQHHADPASLDTMFLRPRDVVPAGAVAVGVALFGPPRAATGALCVALGVLAYDWTHFLIHSGYRPKTRFYRRTWRNHRLHHFRNERYWLGVTSPVADAVLRTSPARSAVPVSRTTPLATD